MKRIGILGGTFDPVHYGHIGLAEDAREQAGLSRVLLIPAKLQPFKLDKQVTCGAHRLAMVRLAVEDIPGLEASDYELKQEQISYTYKTLRAISAEMGEETQLCFITGTDAFLKIDKWKNAEEMLTSYSFAVGSRPGYKEMELDRCIERLKSVYNTDIVKIHNRRRDISATQIRERLESGKSLSGLVPEQVERYILINGLY
ncbi:nicotinate-nucleotide adenylyltransferase [Anaerovorax odorimutans]|uniref:Probable nicotinate-nucleotide adenylyltransferase n=1 Tax=Anaerovorax odorimutans TaxID=109327 RepID=A0ABT1RL37_9FIRM|nr:nicotinate-nucleotide adenylyltransferase [Anaerovorax odorimutans]MCQ4635908.1 nicotinate-nucleotide adenylyltransferase [Anaerovorax odorimutans]